MGHIYFLLRYAPFWVIPLLIIFSELAYLYWIRGRKQTSFGFMSLGFFCLLLLTFYYYSAGPEQSVQTLVRWSQVLSR